MQKCDTAGFCKRNRGKSDGQFSIDASSIRLEGATLSAILLNEQFSKQLQFSLTAYDDGYLRLKVDEDASVGRYKITDLLNPEAEARKASWTQTQKDGNGVTVTFGETSVVLKYKPFRIDVSVQGKPAVTVNSRNMFNFEHRRPKVPTSRFLF